MLQNSYYAENEDYYYPHWLNATFGLRNGTCNSPANELGFSINSVCKARYEYTLFWRSEDHLNRYSNCWSNGGDNIGPDRNCWTAYAVTYSDGIHQYGIGFGFPKSLCDNNLNRDWIYINQFKEKGAFHEFYFKRLGHTATVKFLQDFYNAENQCVR